MKTLKNTLILASALCLVACGTPVSSSETSSVSENKFSSLIDLNGPASSSTESSSKTSSHKKNQWSDEVAELMLQTAGAVAPYIELADGYEYRVIDEDTNPAFFLVSPNDEDITGDYQLILQDEGYESYTTDFSAGYARYLYSTNIDELEIFIQFDFYPGGDHSRGFEIFMWSDFYVPPEINYDLIPDWPEEIKNGFLEKFGEIIPLAPLSEEFEYVWVEEDCNYIFTDKKGRSDALMMYFSEIYNNLEEWVLSYDFYQQGYLVFEKKADNNENATIHLNMRHSNKIGFVVDVWMTVKEPTVLITDWSQEVKDAFVEVFQDEDAVPVAPISNQYMMDFAHIDEGYDIIDILDPNPLDDFYDRYIEILENAGFVENDYYYPRFGYYVFEKVSSEMPDYNIVVNFAWVSEGVSIQIYKEEVLAGTGFTDYFPVEQMKNFMDKYLLEYHEIPQFPSDVDGRYLYTTTGPVFTIEIFQEEGDTSLELAYAALLEADGWEIDDSLYLPGTYWGYFARKEGYDFYLRFFSADVGVFVFHLYPNSYDCTIGFTA